MLTKVRLLNVSKIIMLYKLDSFLHFDFPSNEASPDTMIPCKCYGGVLKFIYPFHIRDGFPKNDDLRNFSMEKWMIAVTPTYFYKVQTQLHVCRLQYADLLCCLALLERI